jgi:hypothetical protein
MSFILAQGLTPAAGFHVAGRQLDGHAALRPWLASKNAGKNAGMAWKAALPSLKTR